MKTTSRVTTEKVAPRTSRARRPAHIVRQQFEDWLADVADENDIARADRLADLFQRSAHTRQKDLANAVGVETRTVQRWLDGGGIKKEYWTPLAEALGTSVQYMIFGEAEPVDPSQLDRIEALLQEILTRIDRLDAAMPSGADALERELEDGSRPPSARADDTESDEPEDQAEGL